MYLFAFILRLFLPVAKIDMWYVIVVISGHTIFPRRLKIIGNNKIVKCKCYFIAHWLYNKTSSLLNEFFNPYELGSEFYISRDMFILIFSRFF